MKVTKQFAMFVLVATTVFVSCKSKSSKDYIVNNWKITDVSGGLTSSTSATDKSKMLENASIEFTKDGKYILKGLGGDQSGTYKLSEDGKSFSITPEGSSKTDDNIIQELTKSKLVFVLKGTDNKMICEAK
jgi:hypothetical protein